MSLGDKDDIPGFPCQKSTLTQYGTIDKKDADYKKSGLKNKLYQEAYDSLSFIEKSSTAWPMAVENHEDKIIKLMLKRTSGKY